MSCDASAASSATSATTAATPSTVITTPATPAQIICPDGEVIAAKLHCLASTPLVDIKANGSDGPITVPQGTPVTISWTSRGVVLPGCVITGGGITGSVGTSTSGNKIAGPFSVPAVMINIQCSALVGNTVVANAVADSVTILTPNPVPASVDIKAKGDYDASFSDGPITVPSEPGWASISWTSQGVVPDSCIITGGPGVLSGPLAGNAGPTGSVRFDLGHTPRVMTLSCDVIGGSRISDSVEINFSATPTPAPSPSPSPTPSPAPAPTPPTNIVTAPPNSSCPSSPTITLAPETGSSFASFAIQGDTITWRIPSFTSNKVVAILDIALSDPCVPSNQVLWSYDSPGLRDTGVTTLSSLHQDGPGSGGVGEAAIFSTNPGPQSLTVTAVEPGGRATTKTITVQIVAL